MRPEVYIETITDLVSNRQDQDALTFADTHADEVSPALTIGQHVLVADMLHMAAMMVAMDEYAARQTDESEHAESADEHVEVA